jgi:hypothetical protein
MTKNGRELRRDAHFGVGAKSLVRRVESDEEIITRGLLLYDGAIEASYRLWLGNQS